MPLKYAQNKRILAKNSQRLFVILPSKKSVQTLKEKKLSASLRRKMSRLLRLQVWVETTVDI
jgi:hypothetical protein